MPPRSINTPVTPRNQRPETKRVPPRKGGLSHDPLPGTIGPTPIKSGLSTTEAYEFIKDVVYPQLKEDINRSMRGLLDVEEFVESVWGFNNAELRWDEWTYKPPTELHDKYKVQKEKARYEPFCGMLDDAFKQLNDAPGAPIRKRTVRLKPNPDDETIKGRDGWGKADERKPDVFGEGLAGRSEKEISTVAIITWNGMPVVGEFKRHQQNS